jgi:hypothetical protein
MLKMVYPASQVWNDNVTTQTQDHDVIKLQYLQRLYIGLLSKLLESDLLE